ncbi:hypothetical protein [Methylobacterium sp. V23]|uniref:hypothetical protein n=1 Tax=Methylobacterium sp. V23 TaxID=2044878 RepID=UPI000CDB756A|nr:hypothetical protein [Methylobacterium sp. V23]POR42533.1 hypothetical protein CRT23_12125 [Methylobacterium sp. V23]
MSRGIESMILGSILGEALKDNTRTINRPKRPVSDDIATLRAASERFSGHNPFKAGDLVTPRADSPIKQAGRPHIVLEVDPAPVANRVPTLHGDANRSDFGARRDMRVASTCDCDHGEIATHWVESWMFEAFVEVAPESAAA